MNTFQKNLRRFGIPWHDYADKDQIKRHVVCGIGRKRPASSQDLACHVSGNDIIIDSAPALSMNPNYALNMGTVCLPESLKPSSGSVLRLPVSSALSLGNETYVTLVNMTGYTVEACCEYLDSTSPTPMTAPVVIPSGSCIGIGALHYSLETVVVPEGRTCVVAYIDAVAPATLAAGVGFIDLPVSEDASHYEVTLSADSRIVFPLIPSSMGSGIDYTVEVHCTAPSSLEGNKVSLCCESGNSCRLINSLPSFAGGTECVLAARTYDGGKHWVVGNSAEWQS